MKGRNNIFVRVSGACEHDNSNSNNRHNHNHNNRVCSYRTPRLAQRRSCLPSTTLTGSRSTIRSDKYTSH